MKRLVPEWQPIAPDGDDETESDAVGDTAENAALPRRFAASESAEEPQSLPGTVAESSAEELHELYAASAHLSAGKTDRALVELRRFLDRDPRHAYADRAENMIVDALVSAGEWSLAIAAANRLMVSFPGTLAATEAKRSRDRALAALGHVVPDRSGDGPSSSPKAPSTRRASRGGSLR